MSFAADLNRFAAKVQALPPLVLAGVTTRMHQSIVGTGQPDPLTGAPGQPVDTGFLKDSWTIAITPSEGRIETNVAYARVIEDNNPAAYNSAGATNERANPDGISRPSVKSKVGGNHSVKLTLAAADRIQAQVVRELAR